MLAGIHSAMPRVMTIPDTGVDYDKWWRAGAGRPCVTCAQGDSKEAVAVQSLGPSFFPMRPFGPDRDDRPVRYLLVAMEPSAGWVKGYLREGKDLAKARNFGGQDPRGDAAVQFAAREWLCEPDETFLLTDIAKCAVLNTNEHPASRTASWRYRNCAPILESEAGLFQLKAVIAVGSPVHDALREREWVGRQPLFRVLHFSNVASSHRARLLTTDAERDVDEATVDRYRAFIRGRQAALRQHGPADATVNVSRSAQDLLAVYRKQLGAIKQASAAAI